MELVIESDQAPKKLVGVPVVSYTHGILDGIGHTTAATAAPFSLGGVFGLAGQAEWFPSQLDIFNYKLVDWQWSSAYEPLHLNF